MEESGLLAGVSEGRPRGARHCSLRRLAPAAVLASTLVVAALLLAAKGTRVPGGSSVRGQAGDAIIAVEGDDDASEWEVIWQTGVHVRTGRSIYTKSLSVKAEKERFRGTQDGDWVVLPGGRGFVLAQSGDHRLVRRIAAPGEPREPDAGQVKPAEGHLEFEVVAAEPARVRMEASHTALVLGSIAPGLVLVGKREGDWVRLWHNRGYVAIFSKGAPQLKERRVTYSSQARGTCSSGRFPITDAAACEAAAVTLGLSSVTVKLADFALSEEGGCFLNAKGALMFAPPLAVVARRFGKSSLICSSKAYTADRRPAAAEAEAPKASTTQKPELTAKVTTTAVNAATTIPATTTPQIRPSLFCWCVAMAKKRAQQVDSEAALMQNAYRSGHGIFACNKWAIYSDEVIPLGGAGGPNSTAIPVAPSQMGGIPNMPPQFKMLLNTDVFSRAWDKVLNTKVFESYEWTVKLDPDCVFFPDRLRKHLLQGKHNSDEPMYFTNCERWHSMQGPVELYSRGAMRSLAANMVSCRQQISKNGLGEDMFMQQCLKKLGMQAVADWNLLHDQYCKQLNNPCADGWTVGFHPYKAVSEWNACYDAAVAR